MASGGGVTLLSLAYLIEISVVLNLAYRELKFADLHKKLKRTIDEIKKDKIKDLSAAIEKYPAFIALTELADDKVGNREGVEEIWRHACNLKLFYYNFIVSMKSLRIVNWSILANVVALIVFIFFSDIQFQATRIENFFYSLAGVAATLIIIALGVFANRNKKK